MGAQSRREGSPEVEVLCLDGKAPFGSNAPQRLFFHSGTKFQPNGEDDLLGAEFRRGAPGEGGPLALTSEQAENVLKFGRYYVLSAGEASEVGGAAGSSVGVGRHAHEALKARVARAGYRFAELVGSFAGFEDKSLIVFAQSERAGDLVTSLTGGRQDGRIEDPDSRFFAELGEAFGQHSIIHSNASRHVLLRTTGREKGQILYGECFEVFAGKPEGDHSRLRVKEAPGAERDLYFQLNVDLWPFKNVAALATEWATGVDHRFGVFNTIAVDPRTGHTSPCALTAAPGTGTEKRFYIMRGTKGCTAAAASLVDEFRGLGIDIEAVSTDAHIAQINREHAQAWTLLREYRISHPELDALSDDQLARKDPDFAGPYALLSSHHEARLEAGATEATETMEAFAANPARAAFSAERLEAEFHAAHAQKRRYQGLRAVAELRAQRPELETLSDAEVRSRCLGERPELEHFEPYEASRAPQDGPFWPRVRGEFVRRNQQRLRELLEKRVSTIVYDDMNLDPSYFSALAHEAQKAGYAVEILQSAKPGDNLGTYPAAERHLQMYAHHDAATLDLGGNLVVKQTRARDVVEILRRSNPGAGVVNVLRDERGRPWVLLAKRFDGKWKSTFGGHVDEGEAPEAAASREVNEELHGLLPITEAEIRGRPTAVALSIEDKNPWVYRYYLYEHGTTLSLSGHQALLDGLRDQASQAIGLKSFFDLIGDHKAEQPMRAPSEKEQAVLEGCHAYAPSLAPFVAALRAGRPAHELAAELLQLPMIQDDTLGARVRGALEHVARQAAGLPGAAENILADLEPHIDRSLFQVIRPSVRDAVGKGTEVSYRQKKLFAKLDQRLADVKRTLMGLTHEFSNDVVRESLADLVHTRTEYTDYRLMPLPEMVSFMVEGKRDGEKYGQFEKSGVLPLISSLDDGPVRRSIVETMPSLADGLAPEADKTAFFDLDSTTIRANTALGSESWYQWRAKKNSEVGLSPDAHYALSTKIRRHIPYSLIEPKLPETLEGLRREGWRLVGLTARGAADMRKTTKKHLTQAGLALDTVLYKDGPGRKKSEAVLRYLSEVPPPRPQETRHVVFFDDSPKHQRDVASLDGHVIGGAKLSVRSFLYVGDPGWRIDEMQVERHLEKMAERYENVRSALGEFRARFEAAEAAKKAAEAKPNETSVEPRPGR